MVTSVGSPGGRLDRCFKWTVREALTGSKTEQRPGGNEGEAIADPLVEATEYDGLF